MQTTWHKKLQNVFPFPNEHFYFTIVIQIQEVETMDEKCTQYESLFTFRTEEELMEHINSCEDCRREHEKMQKVSELIQEVKPYFQKKRKNMARLKVACALFLMIVCGTTLGVINFNTDIADTLKYGETLTAEDLGLPVDSYGLIYLE